MPRKVEESAPSAQHARGVSCSHLATVANDSGHGGHVAAAEIPHLPQRRKSVRFGYEVIAVNVAVDPEVVNEVVVPQCEVERVRFCLAVSNQERAVCLSEQE